MPKRIVPIAQSSMMSTVAAFAATALASLSGFAAVALIAGCGGSFPPPNDEFTAAQGDVGRAEAGGAPAVPEAKLHLQLAQEDLQKSKELINNDNRRAASLVSLARVEAQLALSLAKSSQAQDQSRQAQQELQKAKGN